MGDLSLHIPTITEGQGGWRVFCVACSQEAGDYVPTCLVRSDGWPPLELAAARPVAAQDETDSHVNCDARQEALSTKVANVETLIQWLRANPDWSDTADMIEAALHADDPAAIGALAARPVAAQDEPCTCQPPMYDGDDGYDRDCPTHGAEAVAAQDETPPTETDGFMALWSWTQARVSALEAENWTLRQAARPVAAQDETALGERCADCERPIGRLVWQHLDGTQWCSAGRKIRPAARPVADTEALTAGAEALARQFHESYERLAPEFGYETRIASAVPWDDVPVNNRRLMVAVCAEILASSPRR